MNNQILISDWRHSYETLPDVGVQHTMESLGICERVLGPRALFAHVRIEISPFSTLLFESDLDKSIHMRAIGEGWHEEICLGVLDVMLVRPLVSITTFKCTIKEIKFHEIDSSKQAFRLAARYAAESFLEQEKFVNI